MQCYLCGESTLTTIRNRLRHNIARNVLQCRSCGIVYLEPAKVDLKRYYDKHYRTLYSPVIDQQLSSREIFQMYLPFQQRRTDHIKHILGPRTKVLEIGCSAGHFLYAIKPYVGECIGIEFNSADAEFVNKELNIRTYTTPIEATDLPQGYFDIVTAFQVVEHVDDPIAFLTTISKYMKPGGWIYIEVPNLQDALISVYRVESYEDFWFREPHIFYYSPKSLSFMLRRSGFRGRITTVQEYNFINHVNWILTGKPQKSAEIGMSTPSLVTSGHVGLAVRADINRWVQKIDQQYRRLLVKHGLGDSIAFLGRKIQASRHAPR